MTVSSSTNRVSYSGNGSLTVFAYTFKVFDENDLTVILRASDGTETVQTITTHYTVSGVGDASGGNVTFVTAPTATETVVILREQPLTQGLDLVPNDPFPAQSLEEALDKVVFMTQKHEEELSRAIKASRTNTITGSEFTISASDRANKVFAFDSSGDVSITSELGVYRGNWAAGVAYNQRDLVKDSSNDNIYLANTAHTSSGSTPLSSNADIAKWDLIVNAAAAAASASAAAASETAAETAQTAAETAQTAAETAQTAAETAETNAETAQTAAETAQTAAETAQSAAEAAYDNFDDRYLGAKASDPTLDNDGDALIDGALYFDTTNNVMKVYDLGGTAWNRTTPTSAEQTNIDTVSGISANVTTVAGISSNVTTVAGISADVTTVAADGTDIGTVAGISANVTTVAGVSSDVTTVAGISSDVTTVAADGTDIGTVAGISSDVTTVSGISGSVSTVAGISANVTTVAGISANVTTVAGDTANIGTIATNLNGTDTIGTVAGSISNVNSVGGAIADVSTVASNLTDVQSFANTYRIGATDPTTSLDTGDLFYNTSSSILKVYTGTAWEAGVTAGSGFLPLSGGEITGNITMSGAQTVDGRDLSADGAKLDGIESGATADQTKADIDALGIAASSALTAESSSGNFTVGGDLYVPTTIYHTGDTDTYMQFHANNQWRVVTGGTEMLEVNDLEVKLGANLNANDKILYNIEDIGLQDRLYHEGDSDTFIQFNTDQINFVTANGSQMLMNSNGVFLYSASIHEDHDTIIGTTPTVDANNGGAFSLTMTGNTTFTFGSTVGGYSGGFIIELTGNGSTVTWPASVEWAGGTAPDAPASGETDILVFWTRDGGTTWYGMLAIDAAA